MNKLIKENFGQNLKWPALKGNLIEITGPCKAKFPGGPDLDLDKMDTLEMTGRVKNARPSGGYWFEGIMDDKSHPVWVKAKIYSFGVSPHKFITPQGEELGPEYFSSNPPSHLVKEGKEMKPQTKKLTIEQLRKMIKEEVAKVKENLSTENNHEQNLGLKEDSVTAPNVVTEDNIIAQDDEGVLAFESVAETRARKAKALKEAKINQLRKVIRQIIKENKSKK